MPPNWPPPASTSAPSPAGSATAAAGPPRFKVYAGWVNEADRRAADTMATIVPKPVPSPAMARGPYEVIAEALRERIRSGQLKPGDQLPTIAELAVANTVAVGTAHRALALLRAEGLVEVARGRRATVVLRASQVEVLHNGTTS